MTVYKSETFIDALQADMDEFIREAQEVVKALQEAESCETKEDFIGNMESAINAMSLLREDLRAILGRAVRCRRYSEDRRGEEE